MQRGAKAGVFIRYINGAQRCFFYTITFVSSMETTLKCHFTQRTALAPSWHLVNLFTNPFISGSWTKEENIFVSLISEGDDCSGESNKWQNQKNRKEQEGKDWTAATTEIHLQGGNLGNPRLLGITLQVHTLYLRTFWPEFLPWAELLKKASYLSVLVKKMLHGFHLVTYVTLKLSLEYLWNQVRESSKITLTCIVKTCNTVGFLLFTGKTGNVKPKNLTMKWSRIILNNIIHKVSDFAFGGKKKKKAEFCNSLISFCVTSLSLLRKQI